MPFVILCGLPCSGKTTRSNELQTFLQTKKKSEANIIHDQAFVSDKNLVYEDTRKEKDLRSNLKSAVQRKLNKEDVVILDSLNYIKGCRYELFCVTKSVQTPQCVIWCDVNTEVAKQWNQNRENADRYKEDVFDALVMRFEPPDSRNRWDSPLFIVHPDDELPCEQIWEALFQKKAPPPNQSTQSLPLSSTNFLHELDRVTQDVVRVVVEAQKTFVPGDTVTVPGATEKIVLVRILTLAELQRLRRQYISYTKTHPVDSNEKLCNMFVQFLNNSIK